MTISGKCLCGSIEVLLDEAPDQIIACYCKSCQRATGARPLIILLSLMRVQKS